MAYRKFKDEFLRKTFYCKFAPGLKYGYEWVIMDKGKLDIIVDNVKKYDINIRMV